MAKKSLSLSFQDIVMGATADVIKEAFEARVKIDDLLAAREEAYRKIAELELQVEEIVGVEGEFIYPAPPLPIAGAPKPAESSRVQPKAPARKPAPKKPVAETPVTGPDTKNDANGDLDGADANPATDANAQGDSE